LLLCGEAAIDGDCLPGDERCAGRSEPEDCRRDLIDLADASDGMERRGVFFGVFGRKRASTSRSGSRGGDGVHADASLLFSSAAALVRPITACLLAT